MALGSVMNDFGIPGVREHSIWLKHFDDAVRVRNAISDVCEAHGTSQEPLHTVIGGGGATGVELAGELVGYCKKIARNGMSAARTARVTIIEAGPRLLPGLPDGVATQAKKRLEALGINVRLGTTITEIQKDAVLWKETVSGPDGTGDGATGTTPTHVAVWSGGVKTNPLSEAVLVPKDKRGRCMVDPGMHVGGERPEATVFAIGDISCFLNPATGQPIPGTAYVAIEEAKVAAHNIVAHIRGTAERHYRIPKHYPFIIPIHGKYALVSFGWLRVSGFLGWLVRLIVDLRYFMSILRPVKALAFWARGILIQVKND